ncbi:hypothetical protein PSTT_17128, partial [Puccinia striiformis]
MSLPCQTSHSPSYRDSYGATTQVCRSECHAAPRATLQPSPPMCTSGLNSAGKNGGRMQEKKENLTKSTSSTTPLKTQRSPVI